MPPPGLLAAPRSGGTTSPSKSELIGAARVILDNCGVQFSQNKIVRLVLQFLDRAPRANGHAFFLYLSSGPKMPKTAGRRKHRAIPIGPTVLELARQDREERRADAEARRRDFAAERHDADTRRLMQPGYGR